MLCRPHNGTTLPSWPGVERVRDDAAAERLWNATVRPVAREMASGAAELAERIVARLEAEGHQRPESAFIGFPPA